MQHDMETRVATLEEKVRTQEQLHNALQDKLDAILTILGELRINSALATARTCPAPGKCLELEQILRKMQSEIDTLKDYISQQRGGWKYLMAMGSAAAALGGVVSWLLTHMKGHIP